MKKAEVEEMEKQHAAGYARVPSEASEFEEWESEQVWLEYEERKSEHAVQQTATCGGSKAMAEALERAAEISGKLEGRDHSDSTHLLAEDRSLSEKSKTIGSAEPRYVASRNESLGFAQRTLQNLDHIEQARKAGDDDVHVITQRTVSLLGLIVFPWLEGFDESIKSKELRTLEEEGWPSWSFLQGESKTLGDLLRHLRNAIAHKRLRFSSDSRDPEEVRIEFADAKSDEATAYWRAEISADALLDFCRRFVALVEDTIG